MSHIRFHSRLAPNASAKRSSTGRGSLCDRHIISIPSRRLSLAFNLWSGTRLINERWFTLVSLVLIVHLRIAYCAVVTLVVHCVVVPSSVSFWQWDPKADQRLPIAEGIALLINSREVGRWMLCRAAYSFLKWKLIPVSLIRLLTLRVLTACALFPWLSKLTDFGTVPRVVARAEPP